MISNTITTMMMALVLMMIPGDDDESSLIMMINVDEQYDIHQVWSLAEGALVHCLRGHTHAVRWQNENIDYDDDDIDDDVDVDDDVDDDIDDDVSFLEGQGCDDVSGDLDYVICPAE